MSHTPLESVRAETPARSAADLLPLRPRVLLVEDSLELAWLYRRYLKDEAIELDHAATGAAALEAVEANAPAALLLDLGLPDMNGREVLHRIVETGLPTAVLVITAHDDVETAVAAMRAGADDFMTKPVHPERLRISLRNALERRRLAHLVETYHGSLPGDGFEGFIGRSLPMQIVYRVIESAATSNAPVFITGESGTGKEICAHAIHARSARRDRPLIAINCGAIPRELMESEIFGHVKGAFTGAVQTRLGAAKLADGGTLFLDEICEMDLALQSKLLRFAQSASIRPVGGDIVERVDVRLVCASNRDPLEAVESGCLREDLYYRLHVVPVHLPPLRDRHEDILLLAHHFLEHFAAEEGKVFNAFDAQAEAALAAYHWPGNVRQLQNVLRNIVVLNAGPTVQPFMLPPMIAAMTVGKSSHIRPTSHDRGRPPDIRPLWLAERDLIEDAVAHCGGNVAKAAAILRINPSTIYRKRAAWARRLARESPAGAGRAAIADTPAAR